MIKPIVIAGGGTGGHVYPAIAIADALVEQKISKEKVVYFGSQRGLEAKVIPPSGYDYFLLPGRGIERKFSWRAFRSAIQTLIGIFQGILKLRQIKPGLVISVGGYAAASAVFGALLFRIPLLICESNAVPGILHRATARFAKKCCVGFEGTPLPNAVYTGNPIRKEIANVEKTKENVYKAKQELGIDVDRKLIVSMGGSLGARSVNKATAEVAQLLRHRSDLAILHIVGRRDFGHNELTAFVDPSDPLMVVSNEYCENMSQVYCAADIFIARSGATTCSELCATLTPSVLVPLPNSPGDHQTKNALSLVSAGGAEIISDSNCNGKNLRDLLLNLVDDSYALEKMSLALTPLAKVDASEQIASIAIEMIGKNDD